MKKIISIISLLSVAIFLSGPYPFFTLCQFKIKSEMQRTISAKKFAEIEFKSIVGTPIDFELLDDGNEIRWRGVMYDIVSKHQHGKEIIYTCIRDARETNLLVKLKESLSKNFSQQPVSEQTTEILLQIFALNYLPQELFVSAKIEKQLNKSTFLYKEISSLFSPEKTSPPPELVA